MERKEQILQYICEDDSDRLMIEPMVENFVFLEKQMDELKKLPFIKVHPKNKAMQKATPAAKQYKEFLQQYTNIVKVLEKANKNESTEESPLRAWIRSRGETEI